MRTRSLVGIGPGNFERFLYRSMRQSDDAAFSVLYFLASSLAALRLRLKASCTVADMVCV